MRTSLRSGWLLAVLVVLGGVLRLIRYLADRSLWGDEGALALNIIERSPRELLDPLDFRQGAPTGFLLAEKLASAVVGEQELGLRLFPLAGGIGALIVLALLARRMLRPEAALLAVALAAFSEPLVYFSSEVKQYGTDVFVVVLMLYGAVAISWGTIGRLGVGVLALGGALAVWFSHPALIVLPSLTIVLLVFAWLEGRRAAFRSLALLGGIWLPIALAAYATNRANTRAVATAALHSTGGTSIDASSELKNLWHAYADVVGVAETTTALAWMCALAGLLVLWRANRTGAAIIVAPVVATFAAAVLGRYPFTDRFILFLAPSLIVLLASGAVGIVTVLRRQYLVAGLAAIGLLLAYPTGTALSRAASPPGHEEVKAVLRTVEKQWRPGDALYVWYQTQYPFRYYAECEGCDVLGSEGPASVVWPPDPRGLPNYFALQSHPPGLFVSPELPTSDELRRSLRPLLGKKRVWLIFSSTWDDAMVQSLLDCSGRRLAEARSTRAVAYLYDLSRPSGTRDCVGIDAG
jgi:hypothetical protein